MNLIESDDYPIGHAHLELVLHVRRDYPRVLIQWFQLVKRNFGINFLM